MAIVLVEQRGGHQIGTNRFGSIGRLRNNTRQARPVQLFPVSFLPPSGHAPRCDRSGTVSTESREGSWASRLFFPAGFSEYTYNTHQTLLNYRPDSLSLGAVPTYNSVTLRASAPTPGRIIRWALECSLKKPPPFPSMLWSAQEPCYPVTRPSSARQSGWFRRRRRAQFHFRHGT